MRLFLVWLLLSVPVWADDMVFCDPTHPLIPNAVTRFERAFDPTTFPSLTNILIWTAPHTSMTPAQVTYANQLRSQLDALIGIPPQYWMCTDTNPIDGTLESVREMTQVEKDTLDAPEVVESQRQQAFTSEITTNDLCSSELSALDAKIDTAIDAASNLTQLKTVLKVGLKKVVRCVRARAR